MKAENISIALGSIDDDIIEAVDSLRNRKEPAKQWKRWTVLAACLCLVIGAAAVFFRGFPIIGAKCGGSVGFLVDGSYYYATDFAFYRYIPETHKREYLMSKFNVYDIGFSVDEYGLYYVKGRCLYARVHETSKTRLIYEADRDTSTHISFATLVNGIPILRAGEISITLHDKNNPDLNSWRVVRLDVKTGEIIRQDTLSYDDYSTLSEPDAKTVSDTQTVMQYGSYLAATDDVIFFIREGSSNSHSLYIYDRATGETSVLYDGDDFNIHVYHAATDGKWFFAGGPWGRTDCWKIIYDDSGQLTGLELWAEDI